MAFSASASPSNCNGTVTYHWEFGDGTSSQAQNPSHTYRRRQLPLALDGHRRGRHLHPGGEHHDPASGHGSVRWLRHLPGGLRDRRPGRLGTALG
ncbi:MAG: PKD domain-containing protein [bacterium]|nr:PKD domain-containing protein [bacterium]